jgi:ectoine hydroxylase-related dioxygenase (phytanoyl-CoA dioxygenase family)
LNRVELSLEHSGFEIFPDVLSEASCEELVSLVQVVSTARPGTRDLLNHGWCRDVARQLSTDPRISRLLPTDAVVAQCTYFEKSTSANWLVAFHQDRAIPVSHRVESEQCSGWSVKQGVIFVHPSTAVLETLLAVRVHLDPSDAENGPLRVIEGSHVYGLIRPADLSLIRSKHREVVCTAPRGSVIAFRPLLLHASSKSDNSRPRRVLHFLYGPSRLPDGLAWPIS